MKDLSLTHSNYEVLHTKQTRCRRESVRLQNMDGLQRSCYKCTVTFKDVRRATY